MIGGNEMKDEIRMQDILLLPLDRQDEICKEFNDYVHNSGQTWTEIITHFADKYGYAKADAFAVGYLIGKRLVAEYIGKCAEESC
jgi:hypothetical protein